jgi:hypothetical protein
MKKYNLPFTLKKLAEFEALDYLWIFAQEKKGGSKFPIKRNYFCLYAKGKAFGSYEKNPAFIYEFNPMYGLEEIRPQEK